MGWYLHHLRSYRELGAWEFCWKIAIEGTVIGLVISVVASLIFGGREIHMDFIQFAILAIFIAPPLETVLFQMFPVALARLFKVTYRTQIIISTLVFFVMHIGDGVATGLAAGLVGGFYFAFTYVHWRQASRWTAFWVTALSHCIHNVIIILLAIIIGV